MESNQSEVVASENEVQSTNKQIVKTADGRPIMLWRLGSEAKGWVPSKKHFDAAREFILASGLANKYNVFLFHFGVDIQIIDDRPWWKKIFG